MQRIKTLKGIGTDKDCLIIGGGMSVNDFNFSKIKDMTIIAINNSLPDIKIDYMIYNDIAFLRILKTMEISEGMKVIGYAKSQYKNKADYFYRDEDVFPCINDDNTGLKGIVIAKNIMDFKDIYLIGFDFNTVQKDGRERSHFYGDDIGHKKKYIDDSMFRSHITICRKWLNNLKK